MASASSYQVRIQGIELLVNPPVGELVAFKLWPADYKYSEEEVRLNDFVFTVLDEFGNVHNLALVIDIQSSKFVLRKG